MGLLDSEEYLRLQNLVSRSFPDKYPVMKVLYSGATWGQGPVLLVCKPELRMSSGQKEEDTRPQGITPSG